MRTNFTGLAVLGGSHDAGGRMSWILTATGGTFDYLEACVADVDVVDIASALSKLCRFAGHTRQFYSVAQHSVMVSRLLPPEMALAGLLHDATEAYLVDLPSPLKALLPGYRMLERRVWELVAARFDLPRELPAEVHRADLIMLATERRDLMMPCDVPWPQLGGVVPLESPIEPWAPGRAAGLFIDRYVELMGVR